MFNFTRSCTITVIIVLLLVGCSSRQSPAPVVDVKAHVPLHKRVKSSITTTEYIVKKGETLYSIAWRADLDVRELAQLNNIPPPYRIYPKQKLFLDKNARNTSNSNTSTETPQIGQPKVVKKPVATSKKQAYGGNTRRENSSNNSPLSTGTFSQKISQWKWPNNGRVISKFSTKKQGNKGIDIAGNKGDLIKAAADGKVVYAGDVLRGYGRLIIIKHNDDYLSAYAHNDSILVKEQQTVKAGQVIAKMGDTEAKRVMLHFEVRFRGKSVNPLKYLPRR
ncbi:peptidoglycan DD-metalloendopeptidase family protein [Thalassotalea profundi]|uniref:Peptidase M23 n=1 Tax=Thalassotalea profundi TaxID=2036687 RepID=A0ABQ3IPB6_9GAMM|nr:peptidoglycan DD-metalloendopeptidase family protein [Thalassotalea profundi]GHE87367.1 peptidase M23 [Thalassotalea profundi]